MIELGVFLTKWVTIPLLTLAFILYVLAYTKARRQKRKAIKRLMDQADYYRARKKQ